MKTRGRRESSTGIYHVIAKGIAREKNFNQNREKIYFKNLIQKYQRQYAVKIYAYCIMPNHVHMMIGSELHLLSLFMARVLAEYAFYYNYKHSRNGHVFQNRFTSECIETETYFWNCLRYIHMNPVKSGMAAKPSDYRYSSIRDYFSEQETVLDKEVIERIRGRFGAFSVFEEFHKKRKYEVFRDVDREMEQQQLEIAGMLAEELFAKRKFEVLTQVFEEKDARLEYIEKIRQTLNVSKKKSVEIYERIKTEKSGNIQEI